MCLANDCASSVASRDAEDVERVVQSIWALSLGLHMGEEAGGSNSRLKPSKHAFRSLQKHNFERPLSVLYYLNNVKNHSLERSGHNMIAVLTQVNSNRQD